MTRRERYRTQAGCRKAAADTRPLSRVYTSQTRPREAAGAVTIRKKMCLIKISTRSDHAGTSPSEPGRAAWVCLGDREPEVNPRTDMER